MAKRYTDAQIEAMAEALHNHATELYAENASGSDAGERAANSGRAIDIRVQACRYMMELENAELELPDMIFVFSAIGADVVCQLISRIDDPVSRAAAGRIALKAIANSLVEAVTHPAGSNSSTQKVRDVPLPEVN